MISGIVTVGAMLAFAGVVWWAFGRSRKAKFEEIAHMPLRDEEPHDPESEKSE